MALRTDLTALVVGSLLVGCAGDNPKNKTKTKDGNEAPTLEILEPLEGSIHVEGDAILFSVALSDDQEPADLALTFESGLDGSFGTDVVARATVSFYEEGLSVGDHLVTITATDAGGLSASDTVQFSVIEYDGTYVVDSVLDAPDANRGDGMCDDGAGNCTLRAAILEANEWGQPATITFAPSVTPGTFALTLGGRNEDFGRVGDLDITTDMTILGAGPADTILDGGGLDRVLHVHSGVVATLSGLTIQNGDAGDNRGGGILNYGTLTVEQCHILDNRATGVDNGEGGGGGLLNSGTATVSDSTIRGNWTRDAGGGLCNIHLLGGGDLTVERSTVSNNMAESGVGDGGGIANYHGTLRITNSTISGNLSEGEGGGLYNLNDLRVSNSTITGNLNVPNLSITLGDAIRTVDGATTWVHGSILTGRPGQDDCYGEIVSGGYNLGSDSSCWLTAPGDDASTDAMLGPLQDNGGLTETHALLPGSPAIDAIPIGDCTDSVGNPLTEDQLGTARPQGAACDIGSYEAP